MKTLEIDQLITERLLLIPFTIQICKNLLNNDYSDLLQMGVQRGKSWPDIDVLDTLPKIIKNLSNVPSPTGFESWMVIKKETLEIIGDIGFKGFNSAEHTIDIGYGIIAEERGKGYATEAATELIGWALSNELVKAITASCSIHNIASRSLLTKLHFTVLRTEDGMMYWRLANPHVKKGQTR